MNDLLMSAGCPFCHSLFTMSTGAIHECPQCKGEWTLTFNVIKEPETTDD